MSLRPLLRDPSLSEPALLAGARLLASAQPAPKSEARKRRVWHALNRGERSHVAARLRALRIAFAGLCCAAVSSAAAGHYYHQHQQQPDSAAPVLSVSVATGAVAKQAVAQRARLLPTAHTASPSVEQRVAPRKPEPVAHRAARTDAEAELLLEAMRARNAGNTSKVSELAAVYRKKHPQGALQEEALILAVEAAAARRSPNAPTLASEYLARFPHGRFTAQAKRALSANPG